MAEIAATPDGLRAAALAKQKQRDDAIRANGIKAGRNLERAEICEALGVQRIEEASYLATLTAERDARPTAQEEAKHGRHRFWQGIALGAAAGAAMVSLAFVLVVQQMTAMAFQEAQEATQRGALVGAAAANQDPRTHERPIPHIENPQP